MAVETNGQIVIGGGFTSFNGTQCSYVARLNSDGSLDSTFNPGVGPNGAVIAVAVEPAGEILIGGQFSSVNGVPWDQPALLRADGSLDTGFDTSFTDGAGVNPDYNTPIEWMALQADGKILISGAFTVVSGTNYNGIARLDTNASLDVTFNPGTAAQNGSIKAIGLQSTGDIIVGGNFTAFNGVQCNYVARLTPDGNVDTAFNAGLQDGSVVALAVTPQDQIIICGTFTSINGYSRNGIARLNADGSLDATFNPGLGVGGSVSGIYAQSDGRVVIEGTFSQFNATPCAGLARLNTNGTLDVSFNVGTGPTYLGAIICMAGQPDGKTLIAGSFTSFNGTTVNGIARLNGDGAIPAAPILLNPQLYFGMNLSGTVSNTYLIEWTTNLNTPSLWTPLFDVTLQNNSQFVVDSNSPAGNRFYRAVQIAP